MANLKKSSHSSGYILLINLITSYLLSPAGCILFQDDCYNFGWGERERDAIMPQCLHGIGGEEWEAVGGEAQKPACFFRGAA